MLTNHSAVSKLWQQLAIATNWPVLVAVSVLSSLGVISIWADKQEEGEKQLVFLTVAVGCMALFQAVNYAKIGRFAWAFYIFSLLLVIYTVVAEKVHGLPCCHEIKGVYAWLSFGSGAWSVSLEPAELMKIAFVLLLARYLRFRSNYRTLRGLLAPFALALVPIILILKQPDLGMAMLFLPVLFAMLFVAGAKIGHLALIAGLGMALTPIVWFSGDEHVPLCATSHKSSRSIRNSASIRFSIAITPPSTGQGLSDLPGDGGFCIRGCERKRVWEHSGRAIRAGSA